MSIPAHFKYLILTALFILASINFTKTATEIIRNSKRMDSMNQEVAKLETEKTKLEESINYKQSDDYIEEKARDDLNMIKPGEKVYVIPKEIIESASAKKNVLGEKVIDGVKNLPSSLENSKTGYLSLWLELFFK
ncbi:hypothetical protein A2V49_01660 [candidate division WWE3 bacterium RBG_19FT_COMBO_34_6]|uniref:Septum formation initiator n=1 Tax=candidate division WWE3 bacterium RBG_19FT_COMBO_34_6 TaxID=1802612 RepID=A0A1F4UK93_UNCKA|nr:MAG: hypothetical protein A2V49_01660 [candidate division WWE3 bacterium RBG_19FT_COMBO_34_6]